MLVLIFDNFHFFSVPSRAPSNVRLSNFQFNEIKVQWDPVPQQYVNGRLRGYRIHVYEYDYYVNFVKTVHTGSPHVHMVILKELKAAQRYRITVSAYTSKGEGPQSYSRYITTGIFFNFFSKSKYIKYI